MPYPEPEPKRRRWPLILIVLAVVAGGLWAAGWHYAAGVAERTIEGWKQREARSGRVYNCAAQTIGGFPFSFEYQCAGVSADLRTNQPPLALKAQDILVSARLWQPTVLTSTIVGPMSVAETGGSVEYVAKWRSAQTQVHGLPVSPESVAIAIADASVDRAGGGNVFKASRLDIDGRMLSGTVRDNPVIQIVVKLVAAAAPEWHPAAAVPLDADISAVLRGLKDFGPKPWPQRFRELQAAGGRIEIANARVRQGDVIAVANGVLGLSPRGGLDGQVRLTVANLEKLLPALGLDRMVAPKPEPRGQVGAALGALDRISPALGNLARQNAAPAMIAGLNFLGQPTELEGQRAIILPLRFADGQVFLGPVPVGYTPPLF